jgi:NADPH:quinone reductase-like Zn-dependent oxidoreductase
VPQITISQIEHESSETLVSMQAIEVTGKNGEIIVHDAFPVPRVRANGVVARVKASHVLSFTHLVVDGVLPCPFPFVPGPPCVGIVEQVGGAVKWFLPC